MRNELGQEHSSNEEPLKFIIDKMGLLGFSCNEITLIKFLTIEE